MHAAVLDWPKSKLSERADVDNFEKHRKRLMVSPSPRMTPCPTLKDTMS